MPTYIDQMGRTVTLPTSPSPYRLISLVPSQTELLIDLGATVVGRTKFCVHPAEKVADMPSVGGTKTFRFDVIDELKPDLIVGNKEENYQEGIEKLAERYPVWMSDIYTIADACAMIRAVGALVDRQGIADAMATRIEDGFAALSRPPQRLRVGYLIWRKPLMTIGRETFIHDVLNRCGFENAFADLGRGRYPEISEEEMAAANLDLILLSSEPYPFREKERQAFAEAHPGTAVHLVNGEMFSWYGSRLELTVDYLNQLVTHIHVDQK